MRRIHLAVLSLFFVSSAHADYDKTKWGMDLDAVRSLYVGGQSYQTAVKTWAYLVPREVAGFKTVTRFDFSEDKKLRGVGIMIPSQASSMELDDDILEYSPDESRGVFHTVSEGLTKKYRKPIRSTALVWQWASDVDTISLGYCGVKERSGIVCLAYEPRKTTPDTSGL